VPLCQRLALVLFVMCSTALGVRLYSLWKLGKLGHWNEYPGLRVNGTHFFLDIGAGNNGLQGFSHTRKLEENGWRGFCADRFPDQDRNCLVLSMPVTPKTGQMIQLPDCRGQTGPSVAVSLSTATSLCPTSQESGINIVDVLKISRAPHVIDYISLDTDGMELEILKGFPFHNFCSRSWTVTHRGDVNISAGVQELLASRGCRVKEAGDSYWARCPCSQHSESLLSAGANAHTNATGKLNIRKDTSAHEKNLQAKKYRKRRPSNTGVFMTPSAVVSKDSDPLTEGSSNQVLMGIASGVSGSLLVSPLSR